ncbi:MAG: hypothetical protein MK171_12655 [Pirellulales bacterium]|nr:hypothetical protein [Pirellulales bacterium]
MDGTLPTQLGVTPEEIGVVLVDHGSRRDASNVLLDAVADAFRARTPWKIVEPAHMELAEPSIATAFASCARQGVKLVVVFPYFLSPGRHWSQDIPALSAAAAKPFPGLRHLVTAPLGLHTLLLQVIDERIAHCLTQALAEGPPCDICMDDDRCRVQAPPAASTPPADKA